MMLLQIETQELKIVTEWFIFLLSRLNYKKISDS